MSDHDHIGQGHESEPYVQLIRGVSDEVLREAEYRARCQGYDQGLIDGAAQEKARASKRSYDRRESRKRQGTRDAAQLRRQERFEGVVCLAIAVVLLVAYIAFGGSSS